MTIIATVAALALSQVPAGWSQEALNGIYQQLAQVQQQIDAGAKPTKTRATKLTYGANTGKGKNCLRCQGWYISPDLAVKLGIDPALYKDAQGNVIPSKLYATLQVCSGPNQNKADKPSWLRAAIMETCSAPILSDPGQDAFQVALLGDAETQAADTGSPCACSTGSNCTYQPPPLLDGTIPPPGPAPLGLTLAPGTWSGTGCFRKSCVEWFGKDSYPPQCPK